MKLEWDKAPVRTQWGHDMMEASVAIDKDHTLSLYCERDQTDKVPKVLKPKWKKLTKRKIESLVLEGDTYWWSAEEYIKKTQQALEEINK
jgi:hypothetical protein